jgi:outer membrane protein TolC
MKLLFTIPRSLFLAKLSLGGMVSMSVLSAHAQQAISLEQAINLAQKNDPWLYSSQLKQEAVNHRSIASSTLPDPKISISMMNLPTDSWEFDQEGMTQFKVGVTQMFPRGNTLELKESQLKIKASEYPLLREDRREKLKVMVSELWLEAYLAQKTIHLIESDWQLFEQMVEVAQASYSTALGKTRQQDVIRAQLEIVQLEDRLTTQKQKLESTIARLNEWLHVFDNSNLEDAFDFDRQPQTFLTSDHLPEIELDNPSILTPGKHFRSRLAQEFSDHPAILAIDIKERVSEKEVDLAKQQYKPQWSVNASYSYRDDMPSGQERADLLSVGISFDLPLFTGNRQDKQVAASLAETESVKTEKLLLIKKMISAVEREIKQLNRLLQRQSLYNDQLLTKSYEQAEVTLTAYTNDDGDFSEVVRARIAELNTRISALKIDVEVLKTIARINYFFAIASADDYGNINKGTSQDFGGK